MNEKEILCSSGSDADDGIILDRGKGYDAYYANVNDLRDRIRRMLEDGISTVTILRTIKEDKNCTGLQKYRIMQEMHLK